MGPARRFHQRGALLVLALIFLLIVSLLAMSTVDGTALEMRMAGNSRDQQVAFEAAEYTLAWVESEIARSGFPAESLSGTGCVGLCFTPDCRGGYCFPGVDDRQDPLACKLGSPAVEFHRDPAIWNVPGRHRTLAVPGAGVGTRYIVEFRCYTARDPALPIDLANSARVYRITVLASGPAGRGRVMLRSTMKEG